MNTLHEDLTTRMVASADDGERATALIESEGTKYAITPILFPGKEYGWWELDTEVETTVAVFACNNDDTYHAARMKAVVAAAVALGERTGTVGYVVHRLVDGVLHSSVFEDILSPLAALESAAKAGAL